MNFQRKNDEFSKGIRIFFIISFFIKNKVKEVHISVKIAKNMNVCSKTVRHMVLPFSNITHVDNVALN